MNDFKTTIKQGTEATKKGFRGIFKFLNMVVILALIVGAFILGWKFGVAKFSKEISAINVVTLKNELAEINELATYKYTYTDELEKKTDLQVMDKLKLPFTTNYYRICYSGTIKVGFDLSKAEIDCEQNKVFVKLPKAETLDHYTEQGTVIVLDQKNNLLNPLKMQDVFDEIEKEDSRHLDEAINQGIYDFATENAKLLIRKFIANVYGAEIDVEFI